MRTIIRDNRILFGPIRETNLNLLSQDEATKDFGLSATANPNGVEIYATFPYDLERLKNLKSWYLSNHVLVE